MKMRYKQLPSAEIITADKDLRVFNSTIIADSSELLDGEKLTITLSKEPKDGEILKIWNGGNWDTCPLRLETTTGTYFDGGTEDFMEFSDDAIDSIELVYYEGAINVFTTGGTESVSSVVTSMELSGGSDIEPLDVVAIHAGRIYKYADVLLGIPPTLYVSSSNVPDAATAVAGTNKFARNFGDLPDTTFYGCVHSTGALHIYSTSLFPGNKTFTLQATIANVNHFAMFFDPDTLRLYVNTYTTTGSNFVVFDATPVLSGSAPYVKTDYTLVQVSSVMLVAGNYSGSTFSKVDLVVIGTSAFTFLIGRIYKYIDATTGAATFDSFVNASDSTEEGTILFENTTQLRIYSSSGVENIYTYASGTITSNVAPPLSLQSAFKYFVPLTDELVIIKTADEFYIRNLTTNVTSPVEDSTCERVIPILVNGVNYLVGKVLHSGDNAPTKLWELRAGVLVPSPNAVPAAYGATSDSANDFPRRIYKRDGTTWMIFHSPTNASVYYEIVTSERPDDVIVGIATEAHTWNTIKRIGVAVDGDTIDVYDLPRYPGMMLADSPVYYDKYEKELTNIETDVFLGTGLTYRDLRMGTLGGAVTAPVANSVLDNSILDSAEITLQGRYLVPKTGVSGDFVGNESKYADYDGTAFTFTVPEIGDTVVMTIGPNVGIVYRYTDDDEWVDYASIAPVSLSNWQLGSSYTAGSVAILNGNMYQANGNIPANTAFSVGTTGQTFKLISSAGTMPAENDEIICPRVSDITSGSTVTVQSFTLPSAGTWEVTFTLRGKVSAQGSWISGFLSNSSNVEVVGSRVMCSYIFNNSPTILLNDFQVSGTMTTRITTTGPAGYRLRAFARSYTPGSTATVLSDSEAGYTKINFRKINGFMPATGSVGNVTVSSHNYGGSASIPRSGTVTLPIRQTGASLYSRTSTAMTINANNSVTVNASGTYSFKYNAMFIPSSTVHTGMNTLHALKNGVAFWQSEVTLVPMSRQRIDFDVTVDCLAGDIITFLFEPGGTMGASVAPIYHVHFAGEQIGTTNVSQYMGMLSNEYTSTAAYPSGTIVVKDKWLFQANAAIPANATFTIGTTGQTWTALANPTLRKDVTFVNKAGNNTLAVIADGKLYTTTGTTGSLRNDVNGRGGNENNPYYGLDNLKEVFFPTASPLVKTGGYSESVAYALFANGDLYTWGRNSDGQCGVGSFLEVPNPILASTNVIEVYDHPTNSSYLSNNSRLFIKKLDGYIYCAGYNGFGALGVGNTVNRNTFTQITALGTNVKSVWNMGSYTGCTVVQKDDNTLWVAGYNGFGQLGLANTTNQNSFVQANNLWASTDYELTKVIGGFGYYSTAPNTEGVLGMLFTHVTNGTTLFKMCGGNTHRSLGDGSTVGSRSTPVTPNVGAGNIIDISGNGGGPLAVHVLKENGDLYGFGYNHQRMVGDGTNIDRENPAIVQTQVLKIINDGITGHEYGYRVQSAILKVDGLYMCGNNTWGQCGVGDKVDRSSFVRTRLPVGFALKHLGCYTCNASVMTYLAVGEDNSLYGWGYNAYYGLTSSSAIDGLVPAQFKIQD
jgi:alpha-tubulin suppressor-like RCC1 family protein